MPHKKVTKRVAIPFAKVTKKDPKLIKGKRMVATKGVKGVRVRTYLVTYLNGKEKSRELVKSVLLKNPRTEVTRVGTKVVKKCDPNYSGACVPVASGLRIGVR